MNTALIEKLKADREAARASRTHFAQVASETQDDSYAAQTEGERMWKRAMARGYRETAGRYAALILDLSQQIAALENPIVLSETECGGVDA